MNGTVLVVDDIAANRNVLSEMLEGEAYEVLLAPDGETAIKVAEKARPDLILLDVMMPGLNGFETCRRLKANPDTSSIPVLFISAQNETRSMVDGFKAGGADYIAWKINRHAGTDIQLKPWQRRWPLLAAISLLPQLLRSGAVR